MVDPIRSIHGPSGTDRTRRKKSSPKQTPPPEGDRVEISDGARLAKSLTHLVQFAKSAPDVRAEAVKSARVDLEKGILFSDEVTERAAERFIRKEKPTKK